MLVHIASKTHTKRNELEKIISIYYSEDYLRAAY